MTDLPGRGFRRLCPAAVVCLHSYQHGADEKGGQWYKVMPGKGTICYLPAESCTIV